MISRTIVLSTLVIAFAVAINWTLDRSEEQSLDTEANDPDFYMLDAKISQFNQQGTLTHTLAAARFTHFPLTDLTTLVDPQMLLNSDVRKPWHITSQQGRLIPATEFREEIVELWENVLAVQTTDNANFVNIQTQSLTLYPDREYAETDEKVFIDNQTGRTTAAGMKAFLDTGRFMFYSDNSDRVTTIYLTNEIE